MFKVLISLSQTLYYIQIMDSSQEVALFIEQGISPQFASEMTYEQFMYLFQLLNADTQTKSQALRQTKATLTQLQEDIANSNTNLLKLQQIEARHKAKKQGLGKRTKELEGKIYTVKEKIKSCVQ